MAAVFSFGSFGDVITVIQILDDIRKTLSDGRGSYSEFVGIVDGLDDFIQTLQCLDRIQVQWQDTVNSETEASIAGCNVPTNAFDSTMVSRIRKSLTASEKIAKEFQVVLRRYDTTALTSAKGWTKNLKACLRKIRWALSSTRKDIDSLKINLTFQGGILSQILLAMLVDARFRDLACRIPPSPVIEFLTLVDMLDCTMPVPLRHCTSRKEFHAYVVFLFRERAGRTFVSRGDYSLTAGDESVDAWRAVVKPGTTLMMAAVVSVKDPPAGICPRCHTVNETDRAIDNTIVCCHCGVSFKVTTTDQRKMSTQLVGGPLDDGPGETDDEIEKELQFIRRIDIHTIAFDHFTHNGSSGIENSEVPKNSKAKSSDKPITSPKSSQHADKRPVKHFDLGMTYHRRIQLNNFLQQSYGAHSLRWEISLERLANSPRWIVIAYINDIAYGRGSAHTKAEAKERAAEEALKSFGLPDI